MTSDPIPGRPPQGRRLPAASPAPILRRAARDAFVKLDPRKLTGNPVIFATEIVAVLATVSTVDAPSTTAAPGLRAADRALALGHGAVRQLRRERRRGPRQGRRRQPARHAGHHQGQADRRSDDRARSSPRPPTSWRSARWCWSRPATWSPPTARSSRASPRSTRRPSPARARPVIRESGGDRSAVTGGTTVVSDWIKVRVTSEAGRHLPRPDDRHGRGRRPPQDAQRDRAGRAAGRPDPDLPDRGGDPAGPRAPIPASSSTRWCWARCSSA